VKKRNLVLAAAAISCGFGLYSFSTAPPAEAVCVPYVGCANIPGPNPGQVGRLPGGLPNMPNLGNLGLPHPDMGGLPHPDLPNMPHMPGLGGGNLPGLGGGGSPGQGGSDSN
jgi:hypothetical protein